MSKEAKAANVLQEQQKLMEILAHVKANDSKGLFEASSKFAKEKNTTDDDILAWFRDGNGRNSLHFASNFGYPDLCRKIVEKSPTSLEVRDREGGTALYLATLGANPQVIQTLLELGADMNTTRGDGDFPLRLATRNDYDDIVGMFCERGVKLSLFNGDDSPLHQGAKHDARKALDILVRYAADQNKLSDLLSERNKENKTPMLVAAQCRQANAVRSLLETIASKEEDLSDRLVDQDELGLTPLHYVAAHGLVECTDKMLSSRGGRKAALISDHDGALPLHLAAQLGRKSIVEKLLPHSKIDVEDIDKFLSDQENKIPAEKQQIFVEETNSKSSNEASSAQKEKTDDEMLEEVDMSIPLPLEPTEEERQKALEAKKRGNEAFLAKRYEEAVQAYTEAIQFDGTNEAYYGNRCASYLKLNDLQNALADAKMCRRCRPNWSKGCYRHGMVLMKMERYEDAAIVFYAGVKMDPQSKDLANAFRDAIQKGREQHQRLQQQK